ncbi:MAG: hypothetical protein P1P76_07480 [Anaerolineales bacterium]|nr:hypothetical protein [Anaerolineales bacterium]
MALLAGCGQASQVQSELPKTDQAGKAVPSLTLDPTAAARLPLTNRSFLMGTAGYVPRHYPDPSEEDWTEFFREGAAAYGGLFGVHVNPGDDPGTDGIPQQVALAFENMSGIEPYVAFAVNHEEGPFTVEQGEQLMQAAVATAERYHPRFLSLGVESNSLYLFEPDSFDLYVQYAREIYDAVKTVSPDTLIMNNFQLERMMGKTALTGQDFPPHWELISQFEGKIDLVSFTVYPFLHYQTPREIPADYLQEIREHTDLPLMITETGWPTKPTASGVSGSEEDQTAFLLKLVRQADDLDAAAVIWVFPHDAEFRIAGGIFDSISLRTNEGAPKTAFSYWQALLSLPTR